MCGSSGIKPSLSFALIFGAGMKENGKRNIEKSKSGHNQRSGDHFLPPRQLSGIARYLSLNLCKNSRK